MKHLNILDFISVKNDKGITIQQVLYIDELKECVIKKS